MQGSTSSGIELGIWISLGVIEGSNREILGLVKACLISPPSTTRLLFLGLAASHPSSEASILVRGISGVVLA